jgi:hypothetical protein
MKILIKDITAIEKLKEIDESVSELVDKILSTHSENKIEEVQYEMYDFDLFLNICRKTNTKYSLLRFENGFVTLATMGEANTSVNFRECLMSCVVDEFKEEYTAFKNIYHRLEEDCGCFILLN